MIAKMLAPRFFGASQSVQVNGPLPCYAASSRARRTIRQSGTDWSTGAVHMRVLIRDARACARAGQTRISSSIWRASSCADATGWCGRAAIAKAISRKAGAISLRDAASRFAVGVIQSCVTLAKKREALNVSDHASRGLPHSFDGNSRKVLVSPFIARAPRDSARTPRDSVWNPRDSVRDPRGSVRDPRVPRRIRELRAGSARLRAGSARLRADA